MKALFLCKSLFGVCGIISIYYVVSNQFHFNVLWHEQLLVHYTHLKEFISAKDRKSLSLSSYNNPVVSQTDKLVTPGITHKEYVARRYNLVRLLSESRHGRSYDNHIVILSASSLKIMSNDIPYSFHQDTDFLYLTGLNEPDAVLVLEFNRTSSETKYFLFVKSKDPRRELWDGAVVGEQAAVDYFHADEAFSLNSLHSIILERYGGGEYCIWCKKKGSENPNNEKIISTLLNSKWFLKKASHDLGYNIQMLRLIKSYSEANLIKKSASITAKAFTKVMQNTRSGIPESHLHALLDFECRIRGAQQLSFPPVVAGGSSANTLHYINNTQILRDGDLVLMDGGCEYNGYASDVTRTWPVNGMFTPAQKELYQIVLKVQNVCLESCKPGVSLDHLHHVMLVALGHELQEIGFLNSSLTEVPMKKAAAEFCPHHLGHYLGMDTHDTPLLNRGLPLQAGMVFTLEPGLYVPKGAAMIPERYRGIGIRVEDDVTMTNNGPYVLTNELPKEVEDIEALMSYTSS